VTVLTATNGVNVDAGLQASRTQLFRFETQASGTNLLIQPRAEFNYASGSGLGQNQQRVAAHLQELWDRRQPTSAPASPPWPASTTLAAMPAR
jgi:hypothetical protein